MRFFYRFKSAILNPSANPPAIRFRIQRFSLTASSVGQHPNASCQVVEGVFSQVYCV